MLHLGRLRRRAQWPRRGRFNRPPWVPRYPCRGFCPTCPGGAGFRSRGVAPRNHERRRSYRMSLVSVTRMAVVVFTATAAIRAGAQQPPAAPIATPSPNQPGPTVQQPPAPGDPNVPPRSAAPDCATARTGTGNSRSSGSSTYSGNGPWTSAYPAAAESGSAGTTRPQCPGATARAGESGAFSAPRYSWTVISRWRHGFA